MILQWIVGYIELIKSVLVFGLFMTFCFFSLVFIFDLFLVLISSIYEFWKGRK